MKMTLCPYCMKEAAREICSHCGKPVAYGGEPAHLQAGFVLNGTHPYILGAALGQGGFGITYIALDMVTNQRVAIKEYYPTYCAVRSDARTVTFYRGQEEVYNKGRDRFLDEARVLKSLSDIKSIVNVRDFFEANNTAYLVMEFLEGDSLKSHAQKHGKFPAQEFLKQLRPLMEDIDQMHKRGVVHRDIAPDNIILMPDGQMKLIDFGAARSYVGDKSMTVVVKKGFAPIEQYMRHGSTAATDVYALAATIYYCITGVVPPDSAERQYEEDKLKSPTSLGAGLSKEQERALLKALEIQPKQRTQTVAELIKALEHAPKPEKPKPIKKTEKPKAEPQKKPKWVIPVVAAVLLCILGGGLFLGKESTAAPVETEPQQGTVPVQNVLMRDSIWTHMSDDPEEYGENKVFTTGLKRKQIETIVFLNSTENAPTSTWDVSAKQNKSVLAWAEENGELYNLYIAANGGMTAQSCLRLFMGYNNLKSITFGDAFHTEGVVSMSFMFKLCTNLKEVDLRNIDTSNVTSMECMFAECKNLETVILDGIDTHNVTNMSGMFHRCRKIKNINLSEMDYSSVKEYDNFMDDDIKIGGTSWNTFFVD